MADRIIVMQKGEIVEQGDAYSLFEQPQQAYTKMLLDAIPKYAI
jgi:peptide/nickel transport system ATP-binding protein